MAIEASLNFKGYDIIKVVFDKPLGFSEGNFNINVNHLTHVDEENKNIFKSEFIVTISNEEKNFNLIVQTIGYFEIMGDVEQKVYCSDRAEACRADPRRDEHVRAVAASFA